MDPTKRTLLRVVIPSAAEEEAAGESGRTARLVEQLMGRKPELRFAFIQEKARFVEDLDI